MSVIKNSKWIQAFLVAAFVALGVVGTGSFWSTDEGAGSVLADPTGIKYVGAGRCAAASCHGASKEKPDGTTRHNENTHWAENDSHAKGYSALLKDDSKVMGKALKIDVTKSERCLSCHALSGITVGKTVSRVFLKKGSIEPKKYSIEDGVSCDACHGPAAKYLDPHTKKGWTQELRKKLGSTKLFDQWGLFDTKNVKMRANQCISCHLKIDSDLIEAGHPELPFELNMYSQGDWIHWQDKEKWFGGKAWAMGQTIALREAAEQLAERIGKKAQQGLILDSYKQVVAHTLMARHVANAVDGGSLEKMNKQLADVHAQWKDGAKASSVLSQLARTADGLADKVNAHKFDQKVVEGMLKGIAAEGGVAGAFGFRAAEQFSFSMSSLWSCIVKDAAPADGDAKQEKIEAVYDPLEDRENFKRDKFIEVAKGMASIFPGGKSFPIPAGSPTAGVVKTAEAPAKKPPEKKPEETKKPPEKKPEETKKPPEKKPEETKKPPEKKPEPVGGEERKPLAKSEWGKFVFCPWCGKKWKKHPKLTYCGRCGEKIPKF